MRSFVFFCCCLAFAPSALSIHAQTVPSATRSGLSVSAGVLGSAYQPDYADNLVAQKSPYWLFGPGAYVDVRFSRWVQIEAEGRWLRFNQYLGINENNYLIGPHVPIHTFHGFTPYGKFLVGYSTGDHWLKGRAGTYVYGGGVDYRLSRRFTVRAGDFEYQRWSVNPTLHPYGGSVGISYKVF
jgi:hypothetical protein